MDTNTAKAQFIQRVYDFVLPGMPDDATDHDRETVKWSAETAWNTGCDFADAVFYVRTFEEVNPALSEDEAFARRDSLRAKYAGKHRETTGTKI